MAVAQFDEEREQELSELLKEVRALRKEIAGLSPTRFEFPPNYAVLARTAGELPPEYEVAVRPALEGPSYEVLVRPALPGEEGPVE
jgi:hypothetical protein